MSNALILLDLCDVQAAKQIAKTIGERGGDYRALVFDAMLVDRVAEAGLGPAELLRWDRAPTYRDMHDAAHRAAHAIEAELDGLVQARWPGLSIRSWQHLGLAYLGMSAHWYQALFETMAPRLQGRTLHVPMYDRPQTFFFPSFVPALTLLQMAQREGIAFQAYNDPGQDHAGQYLPALRGVRAAGSGDFVLTHLPTCMYDIGYINSELRASGKGVINLRSRWFDQKVIAHENVPIAPWAQLADALPAEQIAAVDAVTGAMRALLDRRLSDWITATAYRARQVELHVNCYRAQLATYFLLEGHFAQALPSRLLLSDHDAGLHGPLRAFAQRHRVPLLVLPHSKTSGDLDFSQADTTALYHPIQGEAVHDVEGRRVKQFALDIPTELQHHTHSARPLKTVGLLLNSTSLAGVPTVDDAAFVDGIGRIVQWCEQQGLALVIRFKPGYTVIQPLAEQLGLDAEWLSTNTKGSMADFVARCDLCLMYGAPTSGAIDLLSRSVPIMNPLCGPITQAQAATVAASVVPRGEIDEILRQAAAFVADDAEFQRFRRQQFLAFASRFAETQRLRDLL